MSRRHAMVDIVRLPTPGCRVGVGVKKVPGLPENPTVIISLRGCQVSTHLTFFSEPGLRV